MYSILIVDDETGITEGLRFIIQRNLPDCRVDGIAYNGVHGFDLAMQLQPDIILTDIRMPQVDGLEMIRRLIEAGCQAKFIILSGYSEFGYAKNAMALGVKFYIIKPVEEEELYDAIGKACAEIETEKVSILKIQRLEDIAQRNVKESALREVLDLAVDDSSSLKYLLDSCGFPVSHKQYVCALLELNGEAPDLTDKVTKEVTAHLSKYSNTVVLHYSKMQTVIIVSHYETMDYEELVAAIGNVQSQIAENFGILVTAGVGLIYEDIGGMSKSFEEARYALGYKIIKGTGSMITYQEIQNITGIRRMVSQEDISKLEACIDELDIEGCSDVIQGIFAKMAEEKDLSLSDLQLQCLSIILSGIRKMPAMQFQLNENLGKNILSLESVSRFKTLEELKNWLIHTVKSIVELRVMWKVPLKKDIIADIKEYVAENFDKDVNLAELSGKFYLNPYYLSQLFKEKTGDTYLNYLMKLRINRAKELFEKTDLKVYQVCEMVGYSDTNYFSKLFEKFTGRKPSEFKKKAGNHD